MNFRSTFAKSTLAGVAGIMALSAAASVPTFAAAQSAGYYNGGSYYDPCRRDSTNRSTVGALIGGALGAAIGSNAAARNARTEGALLGGALGAMGGAAVGKNSAACAPGSTTYRAPQTSYNGYYGERYQEPTYAPTYDDRRYYERAEPYRVVQAPPQADGCTLAESPIYLPDGRTQKRFVRVCQDANGNYQVVD
jgi:hypothetical protein